MRAKKKLDIFRYLRYNSYINLEKGRERMKKEMLLGISIGLVISIAMSVVLFGLLAAV